MPHSGNAQRSPKAILVSAHRLPGGGIRLVFDGVESKSDAFPQRLRSSVFLTRSDYSATDLDGMPFTDAQFQEIGENLVAMLVPRLYEP